MDARAFLSLFLPLLSWPLARLITARSWPRAASWLLAATALALVIGSTIVLALLAISGLSAIPRVAAAGDWSAQAMQEMEMASEPVELVGGLLLVVVLIRLVIAGIRGLRWAWEVRSAAAGSATELMVIDGGSLAVAVPFSGGRIVVARQLLAELDPGEIRALLAHERAHLRNRHHWFLAVAGLAVALNPLVRPIRAAIEFAVERWADEVAANEVGDRRLVATTLAKVALASHGTTRLRLAATGGSVPRRVSALLSEGVPRHWGARWGAILGVTAALAVAMWSAQATFEATADLHADIEAASLAYHQ